MLNLLVVQQLNVIPSVDQPQGAPSLTFAEIARGQISVIDSCTCSQYMPFVQSVLFSYVSFFFTCFWKMASPRNHIME